MAEKKTLRQEFTKGLIAENPVLRLVLGTCPTLATSTSMVNAIGMGISVTIVLLCSNIVISLLRKVIPSKVRIPAYIVVIASFVTIVQLLIKAFIPALDEALGVFLPLIVVNCILLGRAEAFAGKNSVIASAADGLGMGIGFTAAVFCMATIREFFGNGTLFTGADSLLGLFGITSFTGIEIFSRLPESLNIEPILIFILAPGGFFTFGLLMAVANRLAEKKGKKKADLRGCESCPMAAACALKGGCETEIKEEVAAQ
ncbi:MAG: electron transport complex subunit E [Clostridia bacterium]|nr:electron transport complex subunit E [Clostridia bacterium]